MNICVFLSAYDESGNYAKPVRELGKLIAKGGHALVWGGSDRGLMKVLASSVQDAGGKIIGISTELFKTWARKISTTFMTASKHSWNACTWADLSRDRLRSSSYLQQHQKKR